MKMSKQKLSKLYFSELTAEIAYSKRHLVEIMKEYGLAELIVCQAVRDMNRQFFYCKKVDEVGFRGYCGKECENYTPRNGKNGCCKYWRNTFEKSDKEQMLTLDGKVRELEQ